MTVTALLVSHDGARWLPAVLAGLTGQTLPVDRVAAVDTTSRDDSVALVRAAKARGLRVTADVTPHHLALTHEAVMHAPGVDGLAFVTETAVHSFSPQGGYTTSLSGSLKA